jgi:S-disulfanyl-L-cysteine oxidoreductase SoxD
MKGRFPFATIIGVLAIGAMYATVGAEQTPAPQQQPPAASSTPGAPGTPADTALRSVLDGAYTEEQAKRGQPLYSRECASCHGAMLEGGEEAPPLSGGTFTSNWNGSTVGDVFERIRLTMPADNPGRLSRQDDADVLAYMLSVASFPAGKAELATQTEVLKQIRFEASKPKH